jgi:methylmalonyl-CoA epimerase
MKFDHMGIAVRDLEEAGARLEKLGMKCVEDGVVGPEPDQGYPGLNARWAFYGDNESRPAMLLLQPLSEEGPIHEFILKKGEGVQHIAFAVDDVATTSEALSALGVSFGRAEPFVDPFDNKAHFLSAVDSPGVLVELTEWKEEWVPAEEDDK